MRKCISCGDPLDSRRKDAKFCPKAKCRAKEYRRRRAEATATPDQGHTHQASAIFACPCGRKFLLQVSSLEGQDSGAAPSLNPPVEKSELVTQTVLNPEQPPHESAPHAESPADATVKNSSEQFASRVPDASAHSEQFASQVPDASAGKVIAHPVAATPPLQRELQPSASAGAVPTVPSLPTLRTQLLTFELYFTDQNGRWIRFWDVVRRVGNSIWRVSSYVKPALGFGPLEGSGLGGKPGRWYDFYPQRDPSEFDYDSDLAVLCWDEKDGRAYAAEVELLQAALGSDWKAFLREVRDERTTIRIR